MNLRRDSLDRGGGSLLNVGYCDSGVGLADLNNLLLVVWRGEVTPERLGQQRKALTEVVLQHPGRAGILCVIESSAPPPDDEGRKLTMQMINEHSAQLRAVACVIEGEGFRAAMTRSVLSGLALLLVRSSLQYTFVAKVDMGASWLAHRCNISSERVATAVNELRANLGGV